MDRTTQNQLSKILNGLKRGLWRFYKSRSKPDEKNFQTDAYSEQFKLEELCKMLLQRFLILQAENMAMDSMMKTVLISMEHPLSYKWDKLLLVATEKAYQLILANDPLFQGYWKDELSKSLGEVEGVLFRHNTEA